MASTRTVQQTLTWASQFVNLRPMTLGTGFEPALTIANLVLQTILGPPFRWRWNRDMYTASLSAAAQDFSISFNSNSPVAISAASQADPVSMTTASSPATGTLVTIGGGTGNWVAVNGMWVLTKTAGTTFTIPVVSTAFGAVTGTLTYTLASSVFGFLERASATAGGRTWQVKDISAELPVVSETGRPQFIAAQSQSVDAVTFRVSPVTDQAYTMNMTSQRKAPTMTSLSDTWSPVPDEYAFVYNHGFLAMAMLYADDPRWTVELPRFIVSLVGISQGLSDTEKNIFLDAWLHPISRARKTAQLGQQDQSSVAVPGGG